MSEGYLGNVSPTDGSSEYNALHFLIKTIAGKMATNTVVQVKAVNQISEFEYEVDVQPMVHQTDGNGNVTPHGIVHGLPVARSQGGNGAVILLPAVGDIGMASFAREDITSVRANRAPSPPGSSRRYSYSDGVYLMSVLSGDPTRYVQIGPNGTNIVDPMGVTITTPTLTVMGNLATTGTLMNNGVDVGSTHHHGGVQSGTSVTGVPM